MNTKERLFTCIIAVFSINSFAADLDPASPPEAQPFVNGRLYNNYYLHWSDEFNGDELDENKWEYHQGGKHWSAHLVRNVKLENGAVHLQLKKEPLANHSYTGAGIISRRYFEFGYYEARIRVPASTGWRTQLRMMNTHHLYTDESQVELTAFESNSIDPLSYSTNYQQWRSKEGHLKYFQKVSVPPQKPLNEYHVYGMEWTPQGAYFYLDGERVITAEHLNKPMSPEAWQAGRSPIKQAAADIDKNPVQIWFSSFASWAGKTKAVDDSALPTAAMCDYVRFFRIKSK